MMFSFLFRTSLALLNHRSRIALLDSRNNLGIYHFNNVLLRKRFSSLIKTPQVEEEENKRSFTISYLINSCGLSPDSAKSVSKYVLFDNPTNPDSVLNLFRDIGLTQITHISKVIRTNPQLLLLKANNIILPKIQFLRSIGCSTEDLPLLITRNPALLSRSLEKSLIPFHSILRSLHPSDQKVLTFFKHATFRSPNFVNNLNVNILVLRGLGMPQYIISLFLARSPNAVCQNADKFKQAAKDVIEMGFHPFTYTFASALMAKLQLSPATWKCKIDAFKRWGLSEEDILSAFRRHPRFMMFSEESITGKMDFLVNKMGWQPAVVLNDPIVICYSLEKRIVPRGSVIRVLLLKGLIKSKISSLSVFKPTDSRFLFKYVINHQDQVPELMDIFQGKLDLKELGFGFDEKCAAGTSLE